MNNKQLKDILIAKIEQEFSIYKQDLIKKCTKEEIIDTNTLEIVLDDNIEVETNMNHIYESLYKIYNL